MYELTIEGSLPKEQVNRIRRALEVESGRDVPRTRVRVGGEDSLTIKILAEDPHALRAALNSYLRWFQLALDVEEVIEDGS